jgi:hypothetical protein
LLVPIQKALKSASDLPDDAVVGLRARWLQGHIIRTVGGVALFVLAVAATIV